MRKTIATKQLCLTLDVSFLSFLFRTFNGKILPTMQDLLASVSFSPGMFSFLPDTKKRNVDSQTTSRIGRSRKGSWTSREELGTFSSWSQVDVFPNPIHSRRWSS